MSLPSRLLGANPSIQVSTLLSGSLTTPSAKQAAIPPSSFESISSVTVGAGGQSTITFSSIASTYQHLHIRGYCRAASGTSPDNITLRFNSDSGSNYANRAFYTDGGSITRIGNVSQTSIQIYNGASRADIATYFSGWSYDILNYASTSQVKTIRGLISYQTAGNVGNDANYQSPFMHTGHWNSTAAIDTITLTLSSGNFAQYSIISLYGIKTS